MEENVKNNKKESPQEKVKIYDKDMYVSQAKLNTVVLIIFVFLLGFVVGYLSKDSISPSNDDINSSEVNVDDSNDFNE